MPAATGYLTVKERQPRLDGAVARINLAGRTDFIVTNFDVDAAEFMFRTLVVIEIQSQLDDRRCELQMQVYLLLLMNTKALTQVFGILVYNNGRCRTFQARRDATGNCVYEQNGMFYLSQIALVIGNLLGREVV
jgi:hypothetical protein